MCCAEEGDLRLVSRREANGYVIGAVQVFLDGAFGTVCGALFNNVNADVACRQLGFVGGGISPFVDAVLTDAELKVRTCTLSVHPSTTWLVYVGLCCGVCYVHVSAVALSHLSSLDLSPTSPSTSTPRQPARQSPWRPLQQSDRSKATAIT